MAKHPNHVLQKNAKTGTKTLWCPNCKHLNVLGAVWFTNPTTPEIQAWRTCRHCEVDVRVKDQQIARRRAEKSGTL